MSPVADVREEGEGSSYQDHKGEFVVTFQDIAEKTMKPKDSDSPFKESLRVCLLYTSPSPRDRQRSRMPSSA